ncbi:MAG: substrate-binding domain-containing protein, partial [Pseudomonadota bacterium]
EGGEGGLGERPAVLGGSHDPLLDWALRESGCGLATLLNGSLDGLDCFEQRRAGLAGMHIPEGEGWNEKTVAARGLRGCVLIGWAVRARGLILSPALSGKVAGFADLRGKRLVVRQPGAGATALFDALMAGSGLSATDIEVSADLARTESDAAAAVAAGEGDAALGIAAMARQFSLDFVPLVAERFDLLIDRRTYFTPPVQTLLAFAGSEVTARKAAAMGGYDLGELGKVRWLSP